jgi:hypothetical protein
LDVSRACIDSHYRFQAGSAPRVDPDQGCFGNKTLARRAFDLCASRLLPDRQVLNGHGEEAKMVVVRTVSTRGTGAAVTGSAEVVYRLSVLSAALRRDILG